MQVGKLLLSMSLTLLREERCLEAGGVALAFNPSNGEAEAEAGGSLSSRSIWSTEQVPGQLRLFRESLSQIRTKQNPNKHRKD